MIVKFVTVSSELSTGTFDNNLIEVKGDSGKWTIYVNGKKTKSGPFPTKTRAIREVQISAEKVVISSMSTAVAKQGSFSPRKSAPHGNKRK